MSRKPDGLPDMMADKWEARTVRYEPTPGVYGLYPDARRTLDKIQGKAGARYENERAAKE